jgi:antitoxin ParD1/3/4
MYDPRENESTLSQRFASPSETQGAFCVWALSAAALHPPPLKPFFATVKRLIHTAEAEMTIKTTLSFTDRHHDFLSEKVGQGVFATQSAAVADALEQMMQDEQEWDLALEALTQEIRARIETPRLAIVDQNAAFAAALASTLSARRA